VAEPRSAKTTKRVPLRIDFAAIGGILLAVAGILGGLVLEKGRLQDVAQGTAAMIVLGGTLGAVMLTTPLHIFARACRNFRSVFLYRPVSFSERIEEIIQFAIKTRKNGIVSLETEAVAIEDPFLQKALSMAVDGTDLQEIRKIMEIDMNLSEQAAEAEAKVWEAAGGYAPTIGIIGAVMGLMQVMKHLEDIKEVGHGIAVAFVATVYGVGCANLLFLPAANKLRARIHEVSLLKEMTLEGVVAIVEGLNPTLARIKLSSFDQYPSKVARSKKPQAVAVGPSPQPESAASGD